MPAKRPSSARKRPAPQKQQEKRPLKTLERVISKAGIGSRTEARSWIAAGRVAVNGRTVLNPDQWVDLERARITCDGKTVDLNEKRKVYLVLYKPKGYITTYHDPDGRPTVYDLLPEMREFMVPVGRLDLDTSGLLLMTNDTQFAERLTNPEYKVPKTYLIKASTTLTNEQMDRLRNGVELNDGPTRPAVVKHLRDSGKYTHIEMTITEGRNRQVRRMLEAVDSKVLKLVRVSIGPLAIAGLEIGKWRELEPTEVQALVEAGKNLK